MVSAVSETGGEGAPTTAALENAYDEVAAVLEDVDLAAEPELADEVIAALAAIDRAYAISEGEDAPDA
jgi:hypothetical protein